MIRSASIGLFVCHQISDLILSTHTCFMMRLYVWIAIMPNIPVMIIQTRIEMITSAGGFWGSSENTNSELEKWQIAKYNLIGMLCLFLLICLPIDSLFIVKYVLYPWIFGAVESIFELGQSWTRETTLLVEHFNASRLVHATWQAMMLWLKQRRRRLSKSSDLPICPSTSIPGTGFFRMSI